MGDCIYAFYYSMDFLGGKEKQTQVHFNITTNTIGFNSVFESPAFLFQAIGTAIAEAICYANHREIKSRVFSVPKKAAALFKKTQEKRQCWSTVVCSCSWSTFLVILPIAELLVPAAVHESCWGKSQIVLWNKNQKTQGVVMVDEKCCSDLARRNWWARWWLQLCIQAQTSIVTLNHYLLSVPVCKMRIIFPGLLSVSQRSWSLMINSGPWMCAVCIKI